MEEDMILPDDFEATPQAEEITEPIEQNSDVETAEDTKPAETTEEIESPAPIKIKYNHEEQEIPYDDAVPLIQKGMNFDKAVERARQEARDTYIAEQEMEWNGQPITTEEQYKQALFEQQLMDQYKNRDLPDDVVQELVESRKFREEAKKEREAKVKEEQQQREYTDFFNYFRDANGRDFNSTQDLIPRNVWEMVNQGVPLKFAYMQHQNQELQNQLKTLKQNESNAQKAPVGSVTAHGGQEVVSDDPFLQGFNSI